MPILNLNKQSPLVFGLVAVWAIGVNLNNICTNAPEQPICSPNHIGFKLYAALYISTMITYIGIGMYETCSNSARLKGTKQKTRQPTVHASALSPSSP
jgi:hypothetical protein